MAEKVLQSTETGYKPSSANGSVLSDSIYEERTPEPNDLEARLSWGRKYNGKNWYAKELAAREAIRTARHKEKEREKIEDRKLEGIRRLQNTNPLEYNCQIRIYNLEQQGLIKAQIDKSSQPLSKEEIERNWKGFSALFKSKTLQPVITDRNARAHSESINSQSHASFQP